MPLVFLLAQACLVATVMRGIQEVVGRALQSMHAQIMGTMVDALPIAAVTRLVLASTLAHAMVDTLAMA